MEELTDEHWRTALDLKLMGAIRLTRALLPGMVSRGFGRIVNVAGNADDARRAVLASILGGRIATPEEVAHAVAFFASPTSGHVTGQCLMVDGGQVRGL